MTFPVAGAQGKDWRYTKLFNKFLNGVPTNHPGVDIAPIPNGKTGVPCRSPEAGVIITSNFKPALEGHYVIMRGDSGKYYYFGHFASRSVSGGQRVSEGQQIGVLGMTGSATGIHTHFEVRTTPTGGQINPESINWNQGGQEPMSKVNDGDTTNHYLSHFDRPPTQAELDKNRNKEWNSPDPKLRAPLYNDMIGRARYLTEENKRLQKIVDSIGVQPTKLNPGDYRVE